MCRIFKFPDISRESLDLMIETLIRRDAYVDLSFGKNTTIVGNVELHIPPIIVDSVSKCQALFTWDNEFKMLIVMVHKKPWYISCNRLYDFIDKRL